MRHCEKTGGTHFSNLLNRPSSVSIAVLDQIPQQPTMEELELPPSVTEIREVIQQMNFDRTSGKDGIPAAVHNEAGLEAVTVFHDILSHLGTRKNAR